MTKQKLYTEQKNIYILYALKMSIEQNKNGRMGSEGGKPRKITACPRGNSWESNMTLESWQIRW